MFEHQAKRIARPSGIPTAANYLQMRKLIRNLVDVLP